MISFLKGFSKAKSFGFVTTSIFSSFIAYQSYKSLFAESQDQSHPEQDHPQQTKRPPKLPHPLW
jgi:hypothetical protein